MSKKIIAVANQKGGVGKTTTALNIAAGLRKVNKKVLLIDFDPQGNLSDYLGHEPDGELTIGELLQLTANGQKDLEICVRTNEEGIDYIPSNILLASADLFLSQVMCREQVLRKLLRNKAFEVYDYIIIDCLPSLGILLTNALAASTGVLIPVQTQKFAFDGLQQLEQIYMMVKDNINPELEIEGILLTMADHTNMSKAVAETLRERYDQKVFHCQISRSAEAVNSTYEQKSLMLKKGSKLGQEYQSVVSELLGREENVRDAD